MGKLIDPITNKFLIELGEASYAAEDPELAGLVNLIKADPEPNTKASEDLIEKFEKVLDEAENRVGY